MYQSALKVCVLASCVVFCWSSQDEVFKNYKVNTLGDTVVMRCNDSIQYKAAPNDSMPISWMLPNLTIIYSSFGRFIISPDNWTLTVENITVDDIGQYNCILQPITDTSYIYSNWYLARLGLNIQGPYFDNLWDKYEINTIIGISAGFGFLAMAVSTMLVYHYRYQADNEKDTNSTKGSSSNSSVGLEKMGGQFNNRGSGTEEPLGLKFSNMAFDENGENMSSGQVSSEDGTAF